MSFSIQSIILFSICSFLFVACARDSGDESQVQSRIKGIVDGGAIQPPNAIPSFNPRYPDLKTYGTSSLGYYSVISASIFSLSSGQTFFASAIQNSSLHIVVKRTDTNYFKWIDIYKLISTGMNFICSIRDDGNLKTEMDIDQSTIYIANNTYPSQMRSFNLINCQEGAPIMIPTVVSPWNSCTGWKIMDGEFYGCYSSTSTGQVIRKYNFNSSSMITQFSVPNWSDFQPSFGASSWAVNGSKIFAVQKIAAGSPFVLYISDNVTGYAAWARLPSDDYPDLVYNYSTQYFIHSSDSKIAQVVLVSDKTIKVFSLDIMSF